MANEHSASWRIAEQMCSIRPLLAWRARLAAKHAARIVNQNLGEIRASSRNGEIGNARRPVVSEPRQKVARGVIASMAYETARCALKRASACRIGKQRA